MEVGEADTCQQPKRRLYGILVRDHHHVAAGTRRVIADCSCHPVRHHSERLGAESQFVGMFEIGLELAGTIVRQAGPRHPGPTISEPPFDQSLIDSYFHPGCRRNRIGRFHGPLQRRRDDRSDRKRR